MFRLATPSLRPLVPAITRIYFVPPATRYLSVAATLRMGGATIKESIVDDHHELAEYYEKYTKATAAADKEMWAHQYMWELARHTVAEELVLYPAFEKHLGDHGKEVAKKERAEHEVQKKLQYKLERMKVEDPEYATVFAQLQKDLSEHIVEEEATIDELEAVIPKDENTEITHSISQTKHFVPTRAHPGTHQAPPFETVEGLLLAPIDHLKDLFTKFPTKEDKKA